MIFWCSLSLPLCQNIEIGIREPLVDINIENPHSCRLSSPRAKVKCETSNAEPDSVRHSVQSHGTSAALYNDLDSLVQEPDTFMTGKGTDAVGIANHDFSKATSARS